MKRAGNSVWILLAGFGLLSSLFEGSAFGALLRVTSDTFVSRRNDDLQEPELPFYEFLNASYLSSSRQLALNSNFSLFHEAFQNNNRFDLYTFDVNYEALPGSLNLHAGRSFDVYRSSRALSSDSFGLDAFFLQKRMTVGAFYGVERSLARGNFDSSANLLGSYLNFREDSRFPWYFSTKYQLRHYADTTRDLESIGRFSLQKSLAGPLSPEFLVDSEAAFQTFHLNLLEGGVNLYPGTRTVVRLRAMSYEVPAYIGVEQPIFSIFSQGRLYEGLLEVDQGLSADWSASAAVAYDDYLLEGTTRTHGQRYQMGLRYSGDFASVRNSIYWLDSYGGTAYGDQIFLVRKLTDKWELNASGEATHYNKITSSIRYALASQLGVATELKKQLKLVVSGEANSNNSLQYDYRVNAKLTYVLWSEL